MRVVFVVACFFLVLGVVYCHEESDVVPICSDAVCEGAEIRDVSKLLDAIEDGEDVCNCVCDEVGTTLLHIAARNESVTFADEMVNGTTQCSVDVTDDVGNTPLHTTSLYCEPPLNANLLYSEANVTLKNDDGLNPLCLAAVTDDPDCGGIVNQLVEIGDADICAPCTAEAEPGDPIPFEVAVNENVKNIIAQNGGERVADGGTC